MANILERFSSIMKANINDFLDKREDPSKMIDQNLRELREDLAEVKKETAGIIADEKRAERELNECKEQIENCTRAARNALTSGDEDAARKILVKKQEYESQLSNLQRIYDVAHQNADRMRQMHNKLVDDIRQLESRKESIKGKIAVAKAQQKVNEMTSGVGKANASIESFNRWEEKADKMLDQAVAVEELNSGDEADELVDKYSTGGGGELDAELAKMKAELGL